MRNYAVGCFFAYITLCSLASSSVLADTETVATLVGSVQLAQMSYCRPGRVHAPWHPRANESGCVAKRFLRDDYGNDRARRERDEIRASIAIESKHGVVTDRCDGVLKGGLCKGSWFAVIRFNQPFERPPHVLVSIEEASYQSGCVRGATDKVAAYPDNITRRGFRLYAYGSPVSSNCGASSSWASMARAGWIAIGEIGRP